MRFWIRRLLRFTTVVCGLSFFIQSAQAAQADFLSNQLEDHPAPYLALHGNDPVNWQDWGMEAVDYARENNKILFLSIGYFACHWCHVMQQESYQDPAIAALINENFVPVKIDRELNPALDRRLMDFTQEILGRGGWPLNVFITPDGFPIYSVLYAPPAQFTVTLERLKELWDTSPDQVRNVVEREYTESFPDAKPELDEAGIRPLFDYAKGKIMARADTLSGGFGQQQKFPSVPQLNFLLDQYQQTPDGEVRDFLILTLNEMATQGMFDQLVGGFFRYSVDPQWSVPHFEKMLYDNANLAALYLRGEQILGKHEQAIDYGDIAHQTLDFMRQRMWHEDGALVAAFSAVDDESIEGGSYLWQSDQIRELLSEDEAQLIFAIWGLDRPGELPEGNQPRVVRALQGYAEAQGMTLDEAETLFSQAKDKLRRARDQRSLPVDDKLLASWNGLALSAFARASEYYPDKNYQDVASAIRNFLVTELWNGETLVRAMAKGNKIGQGALEDYAYVAKGLYDWSQVSGKADDIDLALFMVQQAWQRFHKGNAWYQGDGSLLAPTSGEPMITDAASASPAGTLIWLSVKLADELGDVELKNKALSALNRGESELAIAPFWYVSQLTAMRAALPQE